MYKTIDWSLCWENCISFIWHSAIRVSCVLCRIWINAWRVHTYEGRRGYRKQGRGKWVLSLWWVSSLDEEMDQKRGIRMIWFCLIFNWYIYYIVWCPSICVIYWPVPYWNHVKPVLYACLSWFLVLAYSVRSPSTPETYRPGIAITLGQTLTHQYHNSITVYSSLIQIFHWNLWTIFSLTCYLIAIAKHLK